MHNIGSAKETLSQIIIFSGMIQDGKMNGVDSYKRLTHSSSVVQ